MCTCWGSRILQWQYPSFIKSNISFEHIHWHTSHCILLLSIKLKHILQHSDWHLSKLLKTQKHLLHKENNTNDNRQQRKPNLDVVTFAISSKIKSRKWEETSLGKSIWHHYGQRSGWSSSPTEIQGLKKTTRKRLKRYTHLGFSPK